MVKIRLKVNLLVAFIVLIFALISAYFLISIELRSVSVTSNQPKITTIPTTTISLTKNTTIPVPLMKHLLELANENIRDKCNVTFTQVERKHLPTSKWFTDLCPEFKNSNETEKWRTSAYLNGECNLEKENGCIEIFTSISLDEKLICVWAIKHPHGERISLKNLTQKYC